jgi:hypothetical protein
VKSACSPPLPSCKHNQPPATLQHLSFLKIHKVFLFHLPTHFQHLNIKKQHANFIPSIMAYQIIRGPPGQPLPDSPLDPLCRFTKKELTMMMKQIFDFDNRNGNTFWTANSHIPRNRHDEIRRRILGPLVDQALTFNTWSPDWPEEFAIFSPYAATKGEESGSLYSQVRFSGDKKKWYCHRAAYVHQHGPQSLGANQEISHARYLGKRTSR